MNNRVIYIIIAAVVAGIAISSFYLFSGDKSAPVANIATPEAEDTASVKETGTMRAVMKTNFGDITLELFPKDAPKTVENFVKLSRGGFYNGTKFHRVIKGFMIQGGDPNSRDYDWSDDGTGGPGYQFKDEINAYKVIRGALAMANSGPNTNGSQFFIVTADAASWLDGKHTIFGRVAAGMETVDKIENVPTDNARGDHPIQDVTITSIEIATR